MKLMNLTGTKIFAPFAPAALSAALLLAVSVGGGCAERQHAGAFYPKAPEPRNDPTTAHRAFPPSSAEYESTSVIAWNTRAPLVVRPGSGDGERVAAEPLIFLSNIALSPISFALHPPFADQTAYRAGGIEPTHSGAPPYEAVVPADPGPIEPRLSPRARAALTWPDFNFGGDGKSPATQPSAESSTQPSTESTVVEPVEPAAPAAPATPTPAVTPATQPSAPLPEPKRDQPLPPPGERAPLAPAVEVTPIK